MRIFSKVMCGLLVMLSVVSCHKDNNNSEEPQIMTPFFFNGVGYSDLQQAVDAATALNTDGTAHIMLTLDASGKGAVIDKDCEDDIVIDFGQFFYTLEPGCSLTISGNLLQLTSEGGGIKTSDETPAIVATDSSLVALTDGLSIESEMVLSANNSQIVTFDYTGIITGSMVLDGAEFSLFDAQCQIIVPTLVVTGKNAAFQADTEEESPYYTVAVDSLVSDLAYPVTSVRENIIHVGNSKVHVHDMECVYVPGTCLLPGRIDMTCRQCGFETSQILESFGHCPTETLVHHEAKEATELECGNDEFWECLLCGKTYSDKDGKNELTDGALRIAEAFSLDKDILRGLDGVLDWNNEFNTTKITATAAGIILSVVGILETLGLSLPGLISSDAEKWQQVNDKLDAIKAQLDLIDKKIDKILYEIQTIPCKTEINARSKQFVFLKTMTSNAFAVISEITKGSYTNAEKTEKIKGVITDWIKPTYNGDHAQDLTQAMINNYFARPTGMNYPEMYGQFVNGVSRWEHEGYNLRYQMMLNDLSVVGRAYALTGIYLQDMAEFQSKEMRDLQVKSLKESFGKYVNAVKDELNRIKDRDGKYRVYNPEHVSFERTVKSYDFYKWFENHRGNCFPRGNSDGKAVNSCNQLLSDHGLNRDYITGKQARDIYAMHNKNNPNKVSIYKILADSVGFYNCPSSFDPALIFTMNNGVFSHENNDSAIPVYKMWHWEVYRSRNDHDYFGIRTCLNKEANEENHNILYNCDISSWSSGKINKLGSRTKWTWHTILVAK